MTSLLDMVLIDFYQCERERLMDADIIRDNMLKAADIMGAEIISHSFHTFRPYGVSGTVTITKSHLAVHTWPEYAFAAVTFETCGGLMDHRKAGDFLARFFRAKESKISFHKRGLLNPGENDLKYKSIFD